MKRERHPPETPIMRVLRYCFPTFVMFYFWLRERLTLGGASILVAMLLSTPAILQSEPSLVHLFSALAAMLLVTASLSFLFRPRLQVKSKTTARSMRGEIFTVEVWITNLSAWSAYELQLELLDAPRSWEICEAWPSFDSLSPGETVSCVVKIRPKQRGHFDLPPLRVITTFPLHLIRRRVVFAPAGEIHIYPQFAEHHAIELTELSRGTAGMERENAQLSRGSSEYLGNREYQPGVPVRRWDYASWARLGRPIVREYLDVQPAAAAIIVDISHPAADAYGEIPAVEAALAIAAKIADSLVNDGWSIETLILGSEMSQASAQTSSIGLENLLDALACAEPLPERQFKEFRDLVELYAQNQATTFLIFNHWDANRRQLYNALRAIGVDCSGWIIHAEQADVDDQEPEVCLQPILLNEIYHAINHRTPRPTGASR